MEEVKSLRSIVINKFVEHEWPIDKSCRYAIHISSGSYTPYVLRNFVPIANIESAFRLALAHGYHKLAYILTQGSHIGDDLKRDRLRMSVAKPRALRKMLPDADPRYNESACLRAAVEQGLVESVRILLVDGRADPSVRDNWCIRTAVKRGDIFMVTILLADGRVDPTAYNNECIRTAVDMKLTDIIRVLARDPRVDLGCDNNWCIRTAAQRNMTECLELFLDDPRVDPMVYGGECLMYGNVSILGRDHRVSATRILNTRGGDMYHRLYKWHEEECIQWAINSGNHHLL